MELLPTSRNSIAAGGRESGFVAPAILLGISLIIAASIGSYTFYRVRAMDNTLGVTGSAKESVTANIGKLNVSVSRGTIESGIPAAQAKVASDTKAVVDFFRGGGIAEDKVIVSPVFVDQDYTPDVNTPRRYSIRQQVSVQSDDPRLIERLSKEISSLVSKGILISTGMPEYYVTNLPDIRVALIGKAVEDARARAESIVKSTGQEVGALKAASSGVVQVMAPNSIDVSDYGSYDTSTIEKEVMVTARATFFLR